MKISRTSKKISRRDFMGSAAATAAAFTIVPRHVLGGAGYTPPSEKLNIAGVGIGGQGAGDIRNCSSENIVALCDVDNNKGGRTFQSYPNAKQYSDFRVMLEKQKDIEAVIVSTPDHSHTLVAMAAMKLGKHVYVQKPLTRTVYEARMLTEAARKYKVATQMGNQGHSSEELRLICEWIWDGAIGSVREVHTWTNRPIWPQGIDRPQDTPAIPEGLNWDLWLAGAPERPYHPDYHPFNWRGWWDFGGGALADMACHIIDPAFAALKLKYPVKVEASSTRVNNETFPLASIVRFQFPARGNMPPVKLTWYDGGLMPPRPEELGNQRSMGDRSGGCLFIGDKGKLICSCYCRQPRLLPEEKMQEYKRPPQTLPRSKGPYQDWIDACKGGPPASSNFDNSGPFTEMVVMGNLALRVQGKVLEWDGEKMEFTNDAEANQYVKQEYRKGWTL